MYGERTLQCHWNPKRHARALSPQVPAFRPSSTQQLSSNERSSNTVNRQQCVAPVGYILLPVTVASVLELPYFPLPLPY
jgi:hypothetical protein